MSQQQSRQIQNNLKKRNLWIGLGIAGVIGLGFGYSVYFVLSQQKQKRDPDSPYSRNASIRGTFLNAGSRDIGSSKTLNNNNNSNNNNSNN